ncbi:MAG: hypothetical protein BTN85_1428 [Candidatus Methanohalarchaeum thermophilum]|uniref:Uncharacterized protein n=1 Tax=Methanohalarchaeum thermophilum TaxID=1903181 RepID=A0A1Q6DX38_METT1|nr:MAG: hypothetical protein BTN85_1428 [Candidatus Methanohalarchaeum thermophilum]
MTSKKSFWIFALLQNATLGAIIFLMFQFFNEISGKKVIGLDTQILLSFLFPLSLLVVEYITYSEVLKNKKE